MRRAILGGVETIEHGDEGTPEIWKLMVEKNVAYCPTIAAGDATSQYAGWKKGVDPEPARIARKRDTYKAALAAGVKMCFGGDVGVYAHGDNVRELELMVDWGMTPPAALVAATSGNATLFPAGRAHRPGQAGAARRPDRGRRRPVRQHSCPAQRQAGDQGRQDLQGVAMRRIAFAVLFLAASSLLQAAQHGPDKGTLVIVGGNMSDPAIVKRFIDLAGGPTAPIVIIPTAGENDDYDEY